MFLYYIKKLNSNITQRKNFQSDGHNKISKIEIEI